MTKLDELIQELCPDGVEYKPLAAMAQCQKGKNKKHITENAYSITQRGLIPTNEYFGEKTKITSSDTSGYYVVQKEWFVYSPSRIDVGSIDYLHDDGPVIVSPLDVVFSLNQDKVLPDFLLHYLVSHNGMFQILNLRQGIEGTGRKTLPFTQFGKIRIPVPPLPVQEEVVRILDTFTELTIKLTTELEARKQQYEYYRDNLINNQTHIQSVKLGEVANIGVGSKPDTIYDIYQSFEYINAGTTNSGYTKSHNCEGDTVTTPSRGQGGIGFVGYQSKAFWLGPLCYKICAKNSDVLTKYMFYYLQSHNDLILKIKNTGGVPSVNRSDLLNIPILLPSVREQGRIVSILDRFDALCNDLTSGLPAEIEARKKQYEYYRDKLLTFKERG